MGALGDVVSGVTVQGSVALSTGRWTARPCVSTASAGPPRAPSRDSKCNHDDATTPTIGSTRTPCTPVWVRNTCSSAQAITSPAASDDTSSMAARSTGSAMAHAIDTDFGG